MSDADLIELARDYRRHSYSPYSHFPVGAAVLMESGRVFGGCNIENASYTPTVCAERTAFFKAVYDGHRDFTAIAIIGSHEDYTMPCGICRQVLSEFHVPLIICGKSPKDYRTYTLEELFPSSFRAEELKH